jgi:hypothetical protein
VRSAKKKMAEWSLVNVATWPLVAKTEHCEHW